MNCPECGAPGPDDGVFCANCGLALNQQKESPQEQRRKASMEKIFSLGVASLILACVTGAGGIVCGLVTKKYVKAEKQYGALSDKGRTGYALARVGFILGIAVTVLAGVAIEVFVFHNDAESFRSLIPWAF